MTAQSRSLEGKVAVVTGAGRGIGRAIAIAYAREGARVGCAARTTSEIENTVRQIEDAGGSALAIQTDVTKLESVEAMFSEAAEFFGGIDIVVVNAGGRLDNGRIDDGDSEMWLATLEVNLVAAYYTIRSAIPHLKARGCGKIITVGSGIGHRGRVASSAYACAKAGLWMLTRVPAQELWQYDISVNELIPGPVDTRSPAYTTPRPEGSVHNIESEWVKSPEDVTQLALFLATQPDRGPTAQSFSLMRRDN